MTSGGKVTKLPEFEQCPKENEVSISMSSLLEYPLFLCSVLMLFTNRYVMRIVPTTYEDISGSKLVAYQYTYAYR